MPGTAPERPLPLVVAVVGAALAGVALVVLAIASLAAGHGSFSGGVGVVLLAYGAAMLAAAWGLWRRSLFGRGPVVAFSLLNLAAGVTFTGSSGWLWLGVAVSAVTAVAAALPATSAALHLRREPGQVNEPGEPLPRDDRGR